MPVGHVEVNPVTQRRRRRSRIRKKVRGSAARPRLSVFRSSKHIFAQIIDDDRGHTLAQASSQDLDRKGSCKTREVAGQIGKL